MDSKEFIAELSKRVGRPEADVEALVEGLSALLKEECGQLGGIAIPGFGKFQGRKTLERIVEDEQSGKRVLYPPKIEMEFVQSSILKARLAEKGGRNE